LTDFNQHWNIQLNLVKLLNTKCHLNISAVDLRLLQTNEEKAANLKAHPGVKLSHLE
jgi:hypothetical protein